ncbi:hypothetical protein NCLIV_027410 [Neospora caninum Liverpool]|uniref:ABC1 atypical kinase-like domain-containing protein n=1 Tax=Neospora caninum (strain Liverpool) TaxID=572307 RepID=F0VGV8_NEOCL|nr:hypothetical protein NCLIV_027410 [Neospora caninum Liverpool]CBZ52952.1 hypothetical protein NCLIV_027410 [Neospora caninum Liverpool]|eukprot:XP_003882984.1 hypothetical protein NCLIV_027410 [Neospora caninum Liverpool]
MEERRKSACAREQHRQSVKAGDISRPYVRLSASQGSRSSAFSGRLSPSVSAVSAGGRASFSPSASQFRGGFPLFFIPAGRGPAAASQAFGDAADAYFLRHLGTDASVEGEERAVSPVTESSPVRCLSSAPPVGTPESEEEHFLLHLEAEGAGAATPETATDPQEAATSVELRDSKDEGQRQTLTEKLRWTWLLTWKVLQLFAVALPLAICAGVVVLALSGVRHVWGAEETPEGPSDTRRPGRETVQETLERALFQMIGAAASAAGPTYVKCLQPSVDIGRGSPRQEHSFQRQPADGAFAFPHVALLLKSRFGDNWKEELLLDPKPVGSGCIAVVFRGLLRLHVHPDDPTHRRFLSQAFYAFDAPPEDSGPAPPEPATHAQTAGAGAVAVAGTCAGLAAAPGAAGALGSTVSSGALGSTVSSGAAPGVAGALAVGAAALAAEGATKLSEAAVSETQAEDSGGEQRCGKAGGKGERASVAPTRRHCPGLEREDTSSDRVEWSRTDSDGGERKKAGAGPRESDAGSRGVQGSPTEETLWMCVAVKAVKPGTRDSMSADLVILQTLAKIVESLPGMQWLNLSPGAAEFAETMQNQLNLETEARNLLRFRRDFDLPSPSFPSSLSPLSSSSSPPAISTSSSSPSSSSSSPSSSSSSPSSSSSSPSSSSSSISPSSPPSSSLFSPLFLWMASLLPSMPVSDAAPSAPPGVSFPLPVLPLCAPDLLVMTLEEGLPLDLLLRFANERQREKTRAAHTASAGESLPAPRAGRFAAVSASKGTRAKDAHDRKREFDREGRPGTAGDGERERLEQGQGDSVRQDQRREEATGRGDGDAETDAGTSFEAELVRAAKLASRQVDENRERIGLATLHAFLKMLLLNNFLHADLHPGNVLLRRGRSLLPLEPPALHAPCPAEPEDGGAEGSSAGRVGQLQLVFLDSGLAASLDGPDFENFLLLLKAVALARGEQAGRLLVERARRKLADSDAEAFIRAVSDVVKKYHYQDGEGFFLAAAQLGEVFSKMFELSRQHRVVLDSQFANVFLAISILEGVGKQLDPNVDILKTALPYTIQAVKKLYLSKRGRVARGARENVSDEAS